MDLQAVESKNLDRIVHIQRKQQNQCARKRGATKIGLRLPHSCRSDASYAEAFI